MQWSQTESDLVLCPVILSCADDCRIVPGHPIQACGWNVNFSFPATNHRQRFPQIIILITTERSSIIQMGEGFKQRSGFWFSITVWHLKWLKNTHRPPSRLSWFSKCIVDSWLVRVVRGGHMLPLFPSNGRPVSGEHCNAQHKHCSTMSNEHFSMSIALSHLALVHPVLRS